MDSSFDRFLTESTIVWKNIMNKLIELKEWQQLQEEVVRRRQSKQINELNEQNIKLIALTNTDNNYNTNEDNNEEESVKTTEDNSRKSGLIGLCGRVDDSDSIEELRAEDNCHPLDPMDPNNSYGELSSYLETSPVVPGIDGKNIKSFEQLLNIKLNNELINENLAKISENKPKKAFLRKGEGIKRFESKTDHKKVCFKSSESKPKSLKEGIDSKTKSSIKEWMNKRKKEENSVKNKTIESKQFNRKVIPMTTKLDKNINKNKLFSVQRNPPIVLQTETESQLFEYLHKFYKNISNEDISDISIEHNCRDPDINELQDLLNKIELKANRIEADFDRNEDIIETSEQMLTKTAGNIESKKRVHFQEFSSKSPNNFTQIFHQNDPQINNDLIEPKSGAYSSALKRQICELEEQLSRLKRAKSAKPAINTGNCVDKRDMSLNPLNPLNPVSYELKKLNEQIEKINKRLANIESKSYDLLSAQKKELSERKQNVKCIVERNAKTKTKTINSSTNGPNISVNESPNQTTIDFPNGDKMTVSNDNIILYSFANGTTQTTYPDGLKITNFSNGQTEKLHKNGVKHITYANGLQRIINPDSSEELLMTDGTIWRIHSDGTEVLEFENGDREIRTDKYKRREYRNGNIKTLYSDGTEETRYIGGRLRIKDKFGNLMVDSMVKHLDQHI